MCVCVGVWVCVCLIAVSVYTGNYAGLFYMLACVAYENIKWYNSNLVHVNVYISLCMGFLCTET